MKLHNVVSWGRSLTEYQPMFALSEGDLQKRILGCGDGPASFNAEMTSSGRQTVTSVDPLYTFSLPDIARRIAENRATYHGRRPHEMRPLSNGHGLEIRMRFWLPGKKPCRSLSRITKVESSTEFLVVGLFGFAKPITHERDHS
jgi:hypothetical protein